MKTVTTYRGDEVLEAPLWKWLTTDVRAGWLWIFVRVWLGWQWVSASLHKLSSPDWMVTGSALQGYWKNAVAVSATTGKGPITFDWYRAFLQFLLNAQAYTWFSKLVAVGELAVGIFLIIGMFAGIAAFFGALMNFNYMLAGSASTNPLLFVAAIALLMAWKVAGYVGADYFLLRRLGTPWKSSS
jgi:thiosulfate dehydrogenase [quinone] large subunit